MPAIEKHYRAPRSTRAKDRIATFRSYTPRNAPQHRAHAGGFTETETFGVCGPNHSTPSCTMRHWKLYVPDLGGGNTSNVNVTVAPGGTSFGNTTRFSPHVILSCGFCEPSR